MPIFGGSSAEPGVASATSVRSARASRSAMGGIAAPTAAASYQRSGGSEATGMTGIVGTPRRPPAPRYDLVVPPIDIRQSVANLKLERDAIALYDALSRIERDPLRAQAFRQIADNERRHAEIWAEKLRNLGAPIPPADGPRLRVRFIVLVAQLFGTHAVRDLVQALEGDEEDLYTAQSSAEVDGIAADEREHAEIWRRLSEGRSSATEGPARVLGAPERWHRAGRSGTL